MATVEVAGSCHWVENQCRHLFRSCAQKAVWLLINFKHVIPMVRNPLLSAPDKAVRNEA